MCFCKFNITIVYNSKKQFCEPAVYYVINTYLILQVVF